MSDIAIDARPVDIHKLTVYVKDFQGFGPDEVASFLQQQLGRADLGTTIVHEGTKQVEWHDKCDYNFTDRAKAAFKLLFG